MGPRGGEIIKVAPRILYIRSLGGTLVLRRQGVGAAHQEHTRRGGRCRELYQDLPAGSGSAAGSAPEGQEARTQRSDWIKKKKPEAFLFT